MKQELSLSGHDGMSPTLLPLVEAELRRLAKLWLLRELEGRAH